MENKKRKGKLDDDNNKDDALEEEMKMDKFYSLLRSFREARDRRRKELEELEKSESEKKKRKTKKAQPSWVPCFEWGDFITEVEFRRPPLIFPSPIPSSPTDPSPIPCDADKGKKDQHQADDALDLNLAL